MGGVPTPEQVDRCLARTTDKGTAFIWNRDTMEPTFLPPVETPVQKWLEPCPCSAAQEVALPDGRCGSFNRRFRLIGFIQLYCVGV